MVDTLMDHVQQCLHCKEGITFVPAVIRWVRTRPNKPGSRRETVADRTVCLPSPDKLHHPDAQRAAAVDRERESRLRLADPLPYSPPMG